eukprot:CAMPEP_0168508616 /NCGR_PEP_ID=MMETSP0405-20121227/235_1 /TAXON_ID=498012 /ORGANISM="Trichosphaerium sp, Strain Am-I-7 wt" /LENGTH=235 /DNA_ID=CAMNT_0008525815 /DNA_START=143 /DNA_END=850 /DNA_ORIENTATION=+
MDPLVDVAGTVGADCIRITGGMLSGRIGLGDSDDCLILISTTVMGQVNGGGDDDCIVMQDSSVGSLSPAAGSHSVIIEGSDTDPDGDGMLGIVGGGEGVDCVLITANSRVGNIFTGDGDDCIEISQSNTGSVGGGEGNDVFDIDGSIIRRVFAGEGDDVATISNFNLQPDSEAAPFRGSDGDDVFIITGFLGNTSPSILGDGDMDRCCYDSTLSSTLDCDEIISPCPIRCIRRLD